MVKDWKDVSAILAGVFLIVCYLPYWYSILWGDGKPSRASWGIWALLDWVALAGMLKAGMADEEMKWLSICHIGSACIGASVTYVLARLYGHRRQNLVDKICVAIASVAIVLLMLAIGADADPKYAVFLAVFGIGVGAIPTIRSAWGNPKNEGRWGWLIGLLSCLFSVFAVREWTVAKGSQPIGFIAIQMTVVYLVWVRPLWFQPKKQEVVHEQQEG